MTKKNKVEYDNQKWYRVTRIRNFKCVYFEPNNDWQQ